MSDVLGAASGCGASAPAGAASRGAAEPSGDDDNGDEDSGDAALRLSVAELAGHLLALLDDDDRAELAHALSTADTAQGRSALRRWIGWALGLLIVAVGLCWLMHALYFGFLASGGTACDSQLETTAQAELEYLVGYAPAYLRTTLLLFVVKKLCEKVSGFEERGEGLGMARC